MSGTNPSQPPGEVEQVVDNPTSSDPIIDVDNTATGVASTDPEQEIGARALPEHDIKVAQVGPERDTKALYDSICEQFDKLRISCGHMRVSIDSHR